MMGMTNDEVLAFNQQVIADFRANDGVMPEGSPFHNNPTLLMTMTGAKSGRTLTTPLTYVADGDAIIVMASAGGSPKAPAWAFNLRANPNITLEIPGEKFNAIAEETAGDERTRVFELMTAQLPRFAEYQTSVERTIPLFRLARQAND